MFFVCHFKVIFSQLNYYKLINNVQLRKLADFVPDEVISISAQMPLSFTGKKIENP